MSLPGRTLEVMCPMHLQIGSDGRVRGAGPTLRKLTGERRLAGVPFDEVIDIYRPKRVRNLRDLRALEGRKLQLRLRNGPGRALKGLAMPDGEGGVLLNLSFGIGVVEAVRSHALTSTDFAVTDLAIDMLYLVEAKSAAMEASRTLNLRLQGAMLAAEQRAYTDSLTGLQNRRGLDRALQRLVRAAERFALLHVDLDFFKQVNDTRGHAAGDRVLQRVGQIMLEVTRREDLVARIGGDEFVILLAGVTDRTRLAELCERLVGRIEQPIALDTEVCRISASIGIVRSDPEMASFSDTKTLLGRADTALYTAKRNGRAQYAFHEDGPPKAAL
ncbi:MAG: GGDEF domain-containing protein [Rhodobacteraceae bacterium]|jgi:diguanylate cyclase (GGDEF)-like protein|uniref:Diguanylate cyclase (GGDEF) domain-containing protein n=1 Tax=Salipiger profundus TaxID=1229727 RepID=A0A1U7DBU6_9RHOB|nr:MULTISPECIES: GGDEF domain-containing protein [Salipiger]APX25631.1 diguanylate cyclase (GGDEF) domain-containing protein [Salipiger profundus]MAB06313.1 GGDEF domain-containing protein [Paracoccaceae bacterium]GGA04291.1 GGDEF domain-containing protein [Salipiger profundus]SFD53608.1 diguanylate cyclase (GGDEF) domain-containing protein [Salipiger profundus]